MSTKRAPRLPPQEGKSTHNPRILTSDCVNGGFCVTDTPVGAHSGTSVIPGSGGRDAQMKTTGGNFSLRSLLSWGRYQGDRTDLPRTFGEEGEREFRELMVFGVRSCKNSTTNGLKSLRSVEKSQRTILVGNPPKLCLASNLPLGKYH